MLSGTHTSRLQTHQVWSDWCNERKLTAHTAAHFSKAIVLYMMQFSKTREISKSKEHNAFQVPLKLKSSVAHLVWTTESITWEQKQLSGVQF
jgi:hypothetical protein